MGWQNDPVVNAGWQSDPVVSAEPPRAQPASERGFYPTAFRRGLAVGAGTILDAPERAANLAMLPFGYIAQDVFGKTIEPSNYNRFTGSLLRLLDADKEVKPESGKQALLGALVEGAGAGLAGGAPLAGLAVKGVTGGATAAKAALNYIASMGGIGALAGGGAHIGGEIAGTPGAIAGGLAAGVAVPSSALRLGGPAIGTIRAVSNAGKEIAAKGELPPEVSALGAQAGAQAEAKAAPIVEKLITRQVRQSVAGTPNAAANIDEALRLQEKIPGFTPSIAEMSGSPGASALQERYARLSPENMNKEIARQTANLKAIEDYYASVTPQGKAPGEVRGSVNRSIAGEADALEAEQRAPGQSLPTVRQFDVGDELGRLAGAEKKAAKPAITTAYNDAFVANEGATVPSAKIVSAVEEVMGQPLVQIKPENAPQTVAAIKRIFGEKSQEQTGRSIDAELMTEAGKTEFTLPELHAIRVAIGQDVASAGRSMDPAAATRLFNLGKVMPEVDKAISQMPNAKAYQDAVGKYRTEYAPRFKEGANLRVFKDTSANEPRILPERFVSEFFKPDESGGVTRAQQFSQLFKGNPEAKSLARNGILDLYRRETVDPTTGFIREGSHANFLKNHQDALESFKVAGVNAVDDIRRIGADAAKAGQVKREFDALTSQLKFNSTDELVNAALKNPLVMGNITRRMSESGRETFVRLVMDKAIEGRSYVDISTFLDQNRAALRAIPGMTAEHINVLKDIGNAYKIVERAPIKGLPASAGPDVIKNELGVSTATVMSQWRAVTGQRSSVFWATFQVASPILQKLSQTRFSDVMERALHDRKTAIDLRDFLKSRNPAQVENTGSMLIDDLKNASTAFYNGAGIVARHLLGTDRYPANLAKSAIPMASEIQEQKKE